MAKAAGKQLPPSLRHPRQDSTLQVGGWHTRTDLPPWVGEPRGGSWHTRTDLPPWVGEPRSESWHTRTDLPPAERGQVVRCDRIRCVQ
jgi:hypothetical protein